jgi:YVTN family beta-propeller protein
VAAGFLALIAGQAALVHRVAPPPLVRTVTVGQGPIALAVDPRRHHVFVANSLGHSVSVLDARSGALLRTVAVGPDPDAVAVDTRTHRVFVANGNFAGAGSVSVLDGATGELVRTVAVGNTPWAVAVDERAGHAFVANSSDDSVSMLDTRSGAVLRTVAVGQSPSHMAVDAQTGRAFVVNAGPNPTNGRTVGTVSVLDTRTGAVVRTVRVGQQPGALAVDARTARVVVTNRASHTVSVLDARSGADLETVPVGRGPSAVAVDEADGLAVVASDDDKSVRILDTQSGSLLRTVALAQASRGAGGLAGAMAVAVDGRTGRAFVASSDANSVSVLDVRTGTVLRTIPVGAHPLAMAVDERTGRAFVASYGGTAREPAAWWAHEVQRLRPWLPWLPRPVAVVRTRPGSVSVIDASQLCGPPAVATPALGSCPLARDADLGLQSSREAYYLPSIGGWPDGCGESQGACGESRSRPVVAGEHIAAILGLALGADQPTVH